MSIKHEFLHRLLGGIKHKAITSCSQWAENYRVMKEGPWTFREFPWLKEPHDSKYEFNVVQKGAQMGFSELLLNTTFYSIDVRGIDVLYVLPNKVPDATDFSSSRFNPALEMSPYLAKLFHVNNVGLKRGGVHNLFIRGSQSRSGLKSIPVGIVILDEVEEMVEENIPLALERMSGQHERRVWMVSTPHISGRGINKYYTQSTQDRYMFKCPCCSRHTELTFDNMDNPECLVITASDQTDKRVMDSYLQCKECKNKLPHETKPDWLASAFYVPSFADRTMRGYSVSQMYSCREPPWKIALSWLKAQVNPADATELNNSKLGKTYTAPGAQILDEDIDECRKGGQANNTQPTPGIHTMGVDVGTWLHYEIDEWTVPSQITTDLHSDCKPKVIHYGKVKDFRELDALMHKYGIHSCVIDANPEKRLALEFALRFRGRVRLCYYSRGIQGKQIHVSTDQGEPRIQVDRTSWLDLSLSRFKSRKIKLPIDVDPEYRSHLTSLIRVYEKDADENPIGRYVKESAKDDHYAHARNYAEIALSFAVSHSVSRDITERIV